VTNKYLKLCLTMMAAGIFALGAASKAPGKTVDEITLVVDQDALTRGEMEESIRDSFLAQGLNPAKPGTPEYEEAKKNVVEGFIREVLLAEEADRQKVEVSDGEIDHDVDQQLDNMKKQFASEQEFEDGLKKQGISLDDLRQDIHDKILRKIKANRVLHMKQMELPATALVDDADIRKYYDQHPNDFEKVKFSMVLFRIPPKSKPDKVQQVQALAQKALAELKAGADFADYAKKHSEDTGSAANGGEVGTLARSEIADPLLAKGVFSIPVKGLGIIKAADGIYVVKVTSKEMSDFGLAAPEIKDRLQKEKQETALTQWVNGLKKDAYIVEDGKVVPYIPAAEGTQAQGQTAHFATVASSSTGTIPSAAPSSNTGSPTTNGTPAAGSSPEASPQGELYPTLPPGDSWTLSLEADGFSYGTQDLANYYGSALSTHQNFPFGYGLNLEMDYSLDPILQIGVKGEVLRKWGENVTDTYGNNEQWSSLALAPLLSAKLIIPLDEGTNFLLSGAGGYYFLPGSSVTISAPAVAENVNFSSANWGGEVGGALEFLLDDHKNVALDIGAGYRFLTFTRISTYLTTSNGPIKSYPSPLLNTDGTQAAIDFSGVNIDVGLRFFLGKGD
jgi:parvulin-like peptidyl-prolyl isomerase